MNPPSLLDEVSLWTKTVRQTVATYSDDCEELVRFAFVALAGRAYQLQRSVDCRHWETIRTIPAGVLRTVEIVGRASGGKLYYRAIPFPEADSV